jgi:hypothetical protein
MNPTNNKGSSWDLIDDPDLDPETKANVVHNTAAEVAAAPVLGLVTALPGGIEASERQGQMQFVASDILPTEIQDPWVNETVERGSGRKILQAWGFTFGKVIGDDPLFTQARLPPGWTKKGSDHDMWSYILDEQGRERCAVFYKAAFYDRGAHLGITPRYRVEIEYQDINTRSDGPSHGVVKEGERVIFAGPWNEHLPNGRGHEVYEKSRTDAREWFKANIPADIVEQWSKPCPV